MSFLTASDHYHQLHNRGNLLFYSEYGWEFLIRKKNQKDDPELNRIENTFECIITKRLESIACNLGNRDFDIEEFRNKYFKFIQTHPAKLTNQELHDYLRNYMILDS